MIKYVTLPRLAFPYHADATEFLARTVYEAEPQVIDTNLVDKYNNKLFKIIKTDPIGFVTFPDTDES